MTTARRSLLVEPVVEFLPQRRSIRGVTGALADGTPYYAPYGEVVDDGDVVLCHLCGGWYRSVLAHLSGHGWDQLRYREAFGLERRVSLEGAATRARRAEALWLRRDREPAVRAGCREGLRWATSGALTEAAATAARGRPQPEQRRRKTLATLATISPAARAAGARRAADARLRATADVAAARLGFAGIGALVRDRIAHGRSLAAISREAGLHKDWLSRHLSRVDADAAATVQGRVTGPRDGRWHSAVDTLGFADVTSYLSDRHIARRMTPVAIGREIGMTPGTVKVALRRHGISYTRHAAADAGRADRSDAVAARFGFPDLAAYLADRRAAGLSWRAIAAESGQPATWVRRRADHR